MGKEVFFVLKEPLSIHIQSLINIIRRTIGYLPPKKVKVEFTLFCRNGERIIPTYARHITAKDILTLYC